MTYRIRTLFTVALLLLASLLSARPAEAAIVYVGAASGRNDALPTNGTPGALTIPRPAGTAAGMALIASIAVRPRSMTVTIPPGWVEMTFTNQTAGGVSTAPGGMSLITYYKIVGTTEPNNYTWTFANPSNQGGGAVGGILAFSGVDTAGGSPLDVWGAATTGNGLAHSAPAIVTTQANTMVVASISYLSASSFSNPTNNGTPALVFTERLDQSAPLAATAIGTTLQMSTSPRATAGNTGTTSATAASGADTGVGHQMALKPSNIDVSLALTRSGPLNPGGTASYTMTVSNNGVSSEPGALSIVNTLPTGLSYSSFVGAGWACSVAAQVVTCTRTGALAAGASAPALTINVNVAAGASGVLTYTARASGTGGDGNTANNEATNTYIIPSQPYAYYAMDEAQGIWGTVLDSSGNGRNAARLGTANATGGTVPIGSALAGNPGTCGAGTMPSGNGNGVNTAIDVNSLGNSGTIMFWYAGNTAWNDGNSRILFDASNELGNGGADKHFFLVKNGAGQLVFALEDSADTDSTATTVSYGYAANTWHHIAVTWEAATSRIAIYLDGDATPVATSTTALNGTLGDMATLYLAAQRFTTIAGTPAGYTTNNANGYIDEVRLYGGALSPLEIADLADRTHACVAVQHYELAVATTGISCQGTTVTVTACSNNSSPCTSPATTVSGATVTLAASAGSLGATNLVLSASGTATTTLSFPAAADGATATVTLSGESSPATAVRQCCANGTSCTAANSCSITFSTAGFIFASAADGSAADIATQIAGTASGTYQLRAVRTSTTTRACEGALAGANTVSFGYECNNPSTCSGNNLMAINGGTSTTIARNNNGIVPRGFTSVSMTFDANGNAPFTLNYLDVGLVTLWASKPAAGALLTDLAGSTNAFVVKPASLVATATTPAGGANPGSTTTSGAGSAAFMAAGDPFTVNVQGYTSGGAVTPNFGNESTTPSVTFVNAGNVAGNIFGLVTPTANTPSNGTLSTGTSANGNGGGVTGTVRVTNNAWSEVGAFTLRPYLADYLSTGTVTGATSGTIGRFRPARYAVTGTLSVCSSPTFAYVGQPLSGTLTITAQNSAGNTTVNYGKGATSLATLSPSQLTFGGVSAGLAIDTGSPLYNMAFVTSQDFNTRANGTAQIAAALPVRMSTVPSNPISSALQLTGVSDEVGTWAGSPTPVNLLAGTPATTSFRLGRLNLQNAYGSDRLPLLVPVRAEYYNGGIWQLNTADNCTVLSAASLGAGNVIPAPGASTTLALTSASVTLPVATLSGGRTNFRITPSTMGPGSVDLALNLGFGLVGGTNWCGAWGSGQIAGTGTTPAPSLSFLAGNWCGAASDRAPAARIRFGSPRAPYIYLRERY